MNINTMKVFVPLFVLIDSMENNKENGTYLKLVKSGIPKTSDFTKPFTKKLNRGLRRRLM